MGTPLASALMIKTFSPTGGVINGILALDNECENTEPDFKILGPHAIGRGRRRCPVTTIDINKGRPEERDHNYNHGKTFHEAAKQDQRHQHQNHDQPRVQATGCGCFCHIGRKVGTAEKALEDFRTQQDEENHRRRDRRILKRLTQAFP